MLDRKIVAVAGVLALVLIAAPGCVSSKMFKKNVESTDGRVASVEDAVEATGRRIDQLSNETGTKIAATDSKAGEAHAIGSRALTKAEAAEIAAQGKLLWTVTLSDDKVKFATGEAGLTGDAQRVLDDLVARVKDYGKALYLEVEGHTDSTGEPTLNLKLSENRAMAVRNYLNRKGGIPLHAMNTIALGEENPIADNSTKDGRAANRRVVIRVLE
jgi:outer membrane protein OmpA-like peptidoglycan-associated protein